MSQRPFLPFSKDVGNNKMSLGHLGTSKFSLKKANLKMSTQIQPTCLRLNQLDTCDALTTINLMIVM